MTSRKKVKGLGIIGILFVIMILLIPLVYALTTEEAADIVLGNDTNRMILQYCFQNPSGNITTSLVDTGAIPSSYIGYTCDEAFEDNPRVAQAITENKTQNNSTS
ncbi:MAG: hypothetical protein WB501_08220 [Nitrososphaeraceae archaeon]